VVCLQSFFGSYNRKLTINRWIRLPCQLFVQLPGGKRRRVPVSNLAFPAQWCVDPRHRGFDSTMRANELSKKIVASNIRLGLNSSWTFFAPDGCRFPTDAVHNNLTYSFIPRGVPQRYGSTFQLQLHRSVGAIQRQRHLRPHLPASPRSLSELVQRSDPR